MEAARASAVKEFVAKGNPSFNINTVVPSQTIGVQAAVPVYTEEDMALDRELERMARETEPALPIDADVSVKVVKDKDRAELLSDVIDVGPASTVNEMMDQVHQAKAHGCDSIYATDAMIRHYLRSSVPTEVGYFMFHNIKVYIAGYFEQANKKAEK